MTTNQSAAVSEHNPDNVTREQLGEGWRLLTKEEATAGQLLPDGAEWWDVISGLWRNAADDAHHSSPRTIPNITYRRRLSPDDRSAPGPHQYAYVDGQDAVYRGNIAYKNRVAVCPSGEDAARVALALNALEAKEPLSGPSTPPPVTSSTDREIVALRQVVEALERLPEGGSRQRVVEAALVLLGEDKP